MGDAEADSFEIGEWTEYLTLSNKFFAIAFSILFIWIAYILITEWPLSAFQVAAGGLFLIICAYIPLQTVADAYYRRSLDARGELD